VEVWLRPKTARTEPQHDRDWENFFVVTLRDAGQVAIIDGDTYEVVNTVETGYAVHISRMSATGRYVYVIGRDGKLALIDLWMEAGGRRRVQAVLRRPLGRGQQVQRPSWATSPTSMPSSAATGRRTFVMLDGQTLEPFKIVSTRSYTYDTEEYHPEPRVAAIVASHHKPEWIVNVKETGQVWLVNYRPDQPAIKMIEAERSCTTAAGIRPSATSWWRPTNPTRSR
jgi:nitrite reductase (NO-forming) / hydroxylamine reductase